MSTDKLAEIVGRDTGTTQVCREIREAFVVIDRNDLPKATSDGKYVFVDGDTEAPADGRVSSQTVRERALGLLAVSEYLRKNPPVDEKAVKELAKELWEPLASSSAAYDLARRLVADGWKRGVTS